MKGRGKPRSAAKELSKDAIAALLIDAGARLDLAAHYADAFIEYRTATANIDKHGIIVANPRNGSPMENPYLGVRDRALKKLRTMDDVDSDMLWQRYGEK